MTHGAKKRNVSMSVHQTKIANMTVKLRVSIAIIKILAFLSKHPRLLADSRLFKICDSCLYVCKYMLRCFFTVWKH